MEETQWNSLIYHLRIHAWRHLCNHQHPSIRSAVHQQHRKREAQLKKWSANEHSLSSTYSSSQKSQQAQYWPHSHSTQIRHTTEDSFFFEIITRTYKTQFLAMTARSSWWIHAISLVFGPIPCIPEKEHSISFHPYLNSYIFPFPPSFPPFLATPHS